MLWEDNGQMEGSQEIRGSQQGLSNRRLEGLKPGFRKSLSDSGGVRLYMGEMMSSTQQLLERYVRDHSEAAFEELVHRYIDLVYSVALRRVDGETLLAEDVTQLVFTDLARKAP